MLQGQAGGIRLNAKAEQQHNGENTASHREPPVWSGVTSIVFVMLGLDPRITVGSHSGRSPDRALAGRCFGQSIKPRAMAMIRCASRQRSYGSSASIDAHCTSETSDPAIGSPSTQRAAKSRIV